MERLLALVLSREGAEQRFSVGAIDPLARRQAGEEGLGAAGRIAGDPLAVREQKVWTRFAKGLDTTGRGRWPAAGRRSRGSEELHRLEALLSIDKIGLDRGVRGAPLRGGLSRSGCRRGARWGRHEVTEHGESLNRLVVVAVRGRGL